MKIVFVILVTFVTITYGFGCVSDLDQRYVNFIDESFVLCPYTDYETYLTCGLGYAQAPGPTCVTKTSMIISGVHSNIYYPWACSSRLHVEQPVPVYIHAHGGGLTYTHADLYAPWAEWLSYYANAIVIFPDYTLVNSSNPSTLFPLAWNQIYDVVVWVITNGAGLNANTAQVFIGGDSAGSTLAVSALLQLRDKRPDLFSHVIGQLQWSPWISTQATASTTKFGNGGNILAYPGVVQSWLGLNSSASDFLNPYFNVLFPSVSYADFTPSWIIIGEDDPLADHGRIYHDTLKSYNVSSMCVGVRGLTHDTWFWTNVLSPESQWAIRSGAGYIDIISNGH